MGTKEIRSIYTTLHLIFHRNRNQHGKAKWWRWLSMLKRTTMIIAICLEEDDQDDNKAKPSADADAYIQHLAMHIVPRCYLAFSTVVADTQFSALGTVLLSSLSHLAKVTGIDRFYNNNNMNMNMMMENRPPPRTIMKKESAKNGSSNARIGGGGGSEDTGEVVCRSGVSTETGPVYSGERVSESVISSAPKTGEDNKVKARRKKGQKKNAIDDLFDGLL